jgi:hypothetical protein
MATHNFPCRLRYRFYIEGAVHADSHRFIVDSAFRFELLQEPESLLRE